MFPCYMQKTSLSKIASEEISQVNRQIDPLEDPLTFYSLNFAPNEACPWKYFHWQASFKYDLSEFIWMSSI